MEACGEAARDHRAVQYSHPRDRATLWAVPSCCRASVGLTCSCAACCDATGHLASEGEALRVGDWALHNCLSAMHELDFELEVQEVDPRARLVAMDFVSSLLHPDPENRPTSFVEVLHHGLFGKEKGMNAGVESGRARANTHLVKANWSMSSLHVAAALGRVDMIKDLEYSTNLPGQ